MSTGGFIRSFIRESVALQVLHNIYNENINKHCYKISKEPVDITPPIFIKNEGEFKYSNPGILYLYPSKANAEKYLEKSPQLVETLRVRKMLVFEIRGSKKGIIISVFGETDDLEIFQASFINCHPDSMTEIINADQEEHDFNETAYEVFDFVPNAEFYKAATPPTFFYISPLCAAVEILSGLDSEGAYQVAFVPLPGKVHQIVRDSADAEYRAMHEINRTMPSMDATSRKIEYKSPEFFGYYSSFFRLILPAGKAKPKALAFAQNYTYGFEKYIRLKNYTNEQITNMFIKRLCYHTGFLLNAVELAAFLHIPYPVLFQKKFKNLIASAPSGDVPEKTQEHSNIKIGKWACGRQNKDVYFLDPKKYPHTHYWGLSGCGKSSSLCDVAIQNLRQGISTFIIDPQGDTFSNTLRIAPEEYIDKVVTLDFSLEDYIPQITIKENIDLSNPAKFADDMSENMRSITTYDQSLWGTRMSFWFACLFYIYSCIPWIRIPDLRTLISISSRGRSLRDKVRKEMKNPVILDFLSEADSLKSQEYLLPVTTRLGAMALSEKAFDFFTLNENKLSINNIMQEGKLCVINISGPLIGKQLASILGGLFSSLIVNVLMHKASVDYTQRQLSCLILDEFHLIPVDLETQLSTMRKYGLHCVFANQHMFQIEDKKTRNVTTSASSSLIFRLLPEDAEIAARSFGIPAKELIELEPFEAFFFSGGKIFKVKTPKPEFPEKDYSEEIKRRCLEKYYLKKRNNVTIKKKLKYGEI